MNESYDLEFEPGPLLTPYRDPIIKAVSAAGHRDKDSLNRVPQPRKNIDLGKVIRTMALATL